MTESTTDVDVAAAELRELLREAHGAIKDLRRELREARQLAGRLADEAAREVARKLGEATSGQSAETPSPRRPLGMVTCPACSVSAPAGTRRGAVLQHAVGCELADALDDVAGPGGSDAQWFNEHPDADEFIREITPAELADLRTVGLPAEEWASEHSCPLPDWIAMSYKKVRVTRAKNDDGQMWGRIRNFLS